MTGRGSLDPRYRINIKIGSRVMIREDDNPDLTPCYVKRIITKDAISESGIRVLCEDGRMGRVRHIGTETACMSSMDLITNLEKTIRSLIVEELSRSDPDWWTGKIPPALRDKASSGKQRGRRYKQDLQMPDYKPIEEIYFSDLPIILLAKKNWRNHFEEIFHDSDALKVKMSELSSCRNLSAHSKELTEHLEKKIQVYYDDIMSLIEAHRRPR